MKPRTLTLHRFGPFAGTEVVDFDRLTVHGKLFLINGPTGSGKSTVLDGMTYALYGEPRQAGQGPERQGRDFVTNLVSIRETAAADRTRVEFTFDVAGAGYRVVRYPKQRVAKVRKGEGSGGTTEKEPEAYLERLGADGMPVDADTVSGISNVNGALRDILGLSVEQFRQTVVIPQGLFREVVTDNERRINVLKAIFDTQRFADLESALSERKKGIEDQGKRWEERRTSALEHANVETIDDLRAHLHTERERIATHERLRTEAQRALDEANQRLGSAVHLQEQREALARAKEQLEATEAQRPMMEQRRARLGLANAARASESAFEGLTARREDLAQAERGVEEADRGEAAANDALAEAERALARAQERRPRIDALQESLTTLEELRDTLGGLEARERQVTDLTSKVASGQDRATALRAEIDAKVATRDALREERSTLTMVDMDALLKERHDGERQLAVLDEIERLEEAVRQAVDEATAEVGPPAQEVAVSFEAPDLEAYLEAVASDIVEAPHPSQRAAEVAHDVRAAHQVALDEARIEARVEPTRVQLEAARARAPWHDARPTRDELSSAVEGAATRIEEARAAHERIARIHEQLEQLDPELERLQQEEHAVRLDVERSTVERDNLAAALEDARGNVPDGITSVADLDARMAEERTERDELLADVERATKRHGEASTDATASTARAAERRAQLDRAREEHARAESAFASSLRDAGFADEAAFLDARLPSAELDALAREVRDFDEKRTESSNTVEQLTRSLEGSPAVDVEHLKAEVAALEEKRSDLDAELTDLREQLQRLERHEAEYVEAAGQQAELRNLQGAATALSNLARGGPRGKTHLSFETFVLRRQFLDVLAAGNHHFQRMTGNRYSLHLVEDAVKHTALELEVADHHADGARRSVKTLSGGEGFLAAMGLALGMSESAQRAKYPIEALFIDEGFGSLDQATLQEVSRILMTLPDVAGRMVGIISHVEGLKRLIPNQLRVVPAPSGVGNRIVADANSDPEVGA